MQGEKPWRPDTNRDLSCAFCGVEDPQYVHRLDGDRVEFRAHGKGRSLPSFWSACVRCQDLLTRQADAALLELMGREHQDEELHSAALAAFRAADLGAEQFSG